MTTSPAPSAPAVVADPASNPFVVPERLTTAATGQGPRFDDDVWDFAPFVPRSYGFLKLTFTRLPKGPLRQAAKEFIYSRVHRPRHLLFGSRPAKGMKITGALKDFYVFCLLVEKLAELGVTRLTNVRQKHLDRVKKAWEAEILPETVAVRINTIQHIAAHAPFMPSDRLTIVPWKGRAATQVSGRVVPQENLTPRIPEDIMAAYLRAAVFYVETANVDIMAARDEVRALHERHQQRAAFEGKLPRGLAAELTTAFIAKRRAQGRGLPALSRDCLTLRPDAQVVDGVVQAPNMRLFNLMAGTGQSRNHQKQIVAAGAELGWEEGGLDTSISVWPDSGRPWRSRFELRSLQHEENDLRTACWIVIAYLSGMREGELLELRRDCATVGVNTAGRTTYKLHGRVFKGRAVSGDEADWVVLEIVHRAVSILQELNDDPSHLFAYRRHGVGKPRLATHVQQRLNDFRDHVNDLFSTAEGPFIPLDGKQPWNFNSRQFRRTLAWHIAHQPFGVVAGTRQYKHARTTIFEGYAGTSESGFAAEVQTEDAIAKLDYVEDLYHSWNDGTRSSGGAAERIDGEFDRIRRELGDLPGVVTDGPRLRTMLRHLTTTLHPGVLNDCFFNAATAICVKKAATTGRPLPRHNMCLTCPNARRSSIHLPRLQAARDQADHLHHECVQAARNGPLAPLQTIAITTYVNELDQAIDELRPKEST